MKSFILRFKKLLFISLSCFMVCSSISQAGTQKTPEPPVSQAVVDALTRGDLNAAAVALRDTPPSSKSLYLLKQITDIVIFKTSKEHPKQPDAHQFYQNLGIAYHNLYLFLKARNIEQHKFFGKAIKFYKKSRHYATPLHKDEANVLIAALLVSNGEGKKADDLFKNIDIHLFGLDSKMQERLATYYAAKGEVDPSIEALKLAHQERPDAIMTWLVVGDDFYLIKDAPKFGALLDEWRFAKNKRRLELSLPKSAPPKIEFAEQPVRFRPSAAKRAYLYKNKTWKKKTPPSKTQKKGAPKKATRR